MLRRAIKVSNKLGLHARASAKLTQTASKFQSGVWITRHRRRVNAKSIMGVMMLAAGIGSRVQPATPRPDGAPPGSPPEALFNAKVGAGGQQDPPKAPPPPPPRE